MRCFASAELWRLDSSDPSFWAKRSRAVLCREAAAWGAEQHAQLGVAGRPAACCGAAQGDGHPAAAVPRALQPHAHLATQVCRLVVVLAKTPFGRNAEKIT